MSEVQIKGTGGNTALDERLAELHQPEILETTYGLDAEVFNATAKEITQPATVLGQIEKVGTVTSSPFFAGCAWRDFQKDLQFPKIYITIV